MKQDRAKNKVLRNLAAPSPELNLAGDEYLDCRANVFTQLDLKDANLSQLAKHYGVGREEIEELLLATSASILAYLTNFRERADKADFYALVRLQNTRLGQLVERLGTQVSQLDEAILQARLIHDECVKVLTEFKRRSAKATGQKPDITK